MMHLATPPTNYVGTALFIAYIIAALILSSLLVRDLCNRHRVVRLHLNRAEDHDQIKSTAIFATLAAASFTLLSYTMSNVLVQSYIQFQMARGAQQFGLSFYRELWRWMLGSNLFESFAQNLVTDEAAPCWVQLALLQTMRCFLFMGNEGKLNRINKVWAYFLLGQIVPISFAQSLFYISLVLRNQERTVSESSPGAINSRGPNEIVIQRQPHNPSTLMTVVLVYSMILICLPVMRHSAAFLVLAMVLRALLFVPLFKFSNASSIPQILCVLCAAAIVCYNVSYLYSGQHKIKDFLQAFSANPPTKALCFDILVSAVSELVWRARIAAKKGKQA